ncbi:MAG: hypothetical protein V3U46_07245 [Acidimicrobiia bacterium]
MDILMPGTPPLGAYAVVALMLILIPVKGALFFLLLTRFRGWSEWTGRTELSRCTAITDAMWSVVMRSTESSGIAFVLGRMWN